MHEKSTWPKFIPPDLRERLTPLPDDLATIMAEIEQWADGYGFTLPEGSRGAVWAAIDRRDTNAQTVWGNLREKLEGLPVPELPVEPAREPFGRF